MAEFDLQCLVVSALYAMIRQEILGIVMGGVFTTAYAYSFLFLRRFQNFSIASSRAALRF